jgi:hypothetical protein
MSNRSRHIMPYDDNRARNSHRRVIVIIVLTMGIIAAIGIIIYLLSVLTHEEPGATSTPVVTLTDTLTATHTLTPTITPTATHTPTPTITPTVTHTPTPTFTSTPTPTAMSTPTFTATPTHTSTPTPTFTPTATPIPVLPFDTPFETDGFTLQLLHFERLSNAVVYSGVAIESLSGTNLLVLDVSVTNSGSEDRSLCITSDAVRISPDEYAEQRFALQGVGSYISENASILVFTVEAGNVLSAGLGLGSMGRVFVEHSGLTVNPGVIGETSPIIAEPLGQWFVSDIPLGEPITLTLLFRAQADSSVLIYGDTYFALPQPGVAPSDSAPSFEIELVPDEYAQLGQFGQCGN